MKCINCGNDVFDGTDLCLKCKTNINVNNNNQISMPNKKNNKGFKLAILLLIVVLVIVSLAYVKINYFSKKKNNIEKTNELVKYNSIEKIKNDYNAGNLSINDYFTQLVYLEFDSSKLNPKYNSDYEYYNSGCELETASILGNYYDKLDKDIVKFYLINKTLSNISLGDSSVSNQSNVSDDYKIKPLAHEENAEVAANHKLNRVALSKNGNFLIWYASYGSDSITDEQLNLISEGLEDSIHEYEKEFNIKYVYMPYIDNQHFNDDWKNAKKTLESNNIPITALKTAMSVYIYDTGSKGTLATYIDEQDSVKWINRSLFLDILDEDGIVNYPYIVINKKGLSKGKDSLIQLYNHELFHHIQALYCKSTSNKQCGSDLRITEGMANFASAKVSNVDGTNAYLNEWAGIYTVNTSEKLADIVNLSGSLGYALFPYFYSYSLQNKNWASVLMEAHNQEEPFKYIQNNTSEIALINAINDLAYHTLSQDYNNKSLISNTGIRTRSKVDNSKNTKLTINAGSIDFFEIDEKSEVTISTNGNSYLTLKVYGFKDEVYKELKSSHNKIELDTAFFVNYDKFFLVVTNANLVNSYDYTITVGDSKFAENTEYVTTFSNYNIDIVMNTKIGGIEVEQHSKGIVDELHQKEYLDVNTTTMGFTISTKMYYDFNNGCTYMTQPYGGDAWWKENDASKLIDLGKILDKLISMKNVTKISKNHYKVKMTPSDLKGLMTSAKSNTSAIKGNVDVDVYTENGYIVKLEYDFSKMVKGFELFKTTINFSNYDKAGDVKIPQTIIDNAKTV